MAHIKPWVKLLRPLNGTISFIGTIVGGLSVVGLSTSYLRSDLFALILAGIATFLVTSAGNVLNDYLDAEGDALNHPDRPLPRKEVTREGVRNYAIVLFALSALPLLLIFPWPGGGLVHGFGLDYYALTLIVWGSSVAFLLAYELRLKAVGLLGNATVAYLTGAVFLFGASVTGNPILAIPWLLMAFFATLSREVTKDMEDVAGDKDRVTLPKQYGMGTASAASRVSVLVAIAISPFPLRTWLAPLSMAGLAYLVAVLVADALFVLSVVWLPERLHREQGLSKLAMVFALVAFMGASLR